MTSARLPGALPVSQDGGIFSAQVPTIGEIRAVAAPPHPSWERREFPAPGGGYTLTLRDPDEWAMGADGWNVELRDSSGDVTPDHSYLRYLNNRAGVVADSTMAPWLADGTAVGLIPTGRDSPHSPVVYEIESERRNEVQATGWCLTVQCAPVGDRILVPRIGGFELITRGQSLRSLDWSHPEREWPHSGWLASGQVWYAIGRSKHGGVSWIWFLDPDGEVLAKERLDPFDVEPFDRDVYADAIRSGYSLKMGDGVRSLGTQLLRWTDSRPDPEHNRVLLAMTRPTGPPVTVERELLCDTEQRWVSVELRED